jgi:BASS family bile acid:Na+ symporter
MNDINNIRINAAENLWVLSFCLGFIMFSIALDLKKEDFVRLAKNPKAAIAGVFAQYVVYPLVVFLFIKIAQPHPSIGLGLLLVAVCPSGNISNFITHAAKGNVALAISLTGISTVFAPLATPILFAFYASLDAGMLGIMQTFHLSFWDMLKNVSMLLLLPLLFALFLSYKAPKFVEKIKKSVRITALLIFVAFLFFAIKANFAEFRKYAHLVLLVVFIADLLGFIVGFYSGKIFRLNYADCKTLSIETGIHNAGLGLVLIFSFFGGMGGMALVAAWWGIWHLIAGMALANYWKRKEE